MAISDKGGVPYRCEFPAPAKVYGNPADGCSFTFGRAGETSEHSKAFIYPRRGGGNLCS